MGKRIKQIVGLVALCCLALGMYWWSDTMPVQATPQVSSEVSQATPGAEGRLALSPEEAAYQQQHPVVTVAVDASWRPLEYRDAKTKQYTGILAEVFKHLEAYTGFKFEFVIMDNYEQAIEAVASGKADMLSGLAYDQQMAEECRVKLTAPYITINSAIVSKDKATRHLYKNIDAKKIAVVANDYANHLITAKIPNVQLQELESSEACLQAVKNGQVDLAILAAYVSEYYMRVPQYSSLQSHTISDFSWQQSFGVNQNADPMLLQILNKGVAKIAGNDVNQAVYDGLMGATYENEWLLFVYKNPVAVIGSILFVVFVIGALLWKIQHMRQKAMQRSIENGIRLSLAMSRTHLCIWEIELATGDVIQIDNEHEKHGFYALRKNTFDQAIALGYIHPEDVENLQEVRKRIHAGEQKAEGGWRVKKLPEGEQGTEYWWERVLFQVIKDKNGKPIRVIGISEDVTKEKLAEKDSLTAVYNRKGFENAATQVLSERRKAYLQCAFLLLDLDGFKQINDTYGHATGDSVLIALGATLQRTFRTTDLVGRLGGDEFMVFMTSIAKAEDALMKAQELVVNVSKLQEQEGYPFAVNCSVGVVVAEKGRDDFTSLYKKADLALYQAKNAGKNQYQLYE